MAYQYGESFSKQKTRAKKIRAVLATFVILLILGAVAIAVDWMLSKNNSSSTVTSNVSITSVQSVNTSVYKTAFFQFEATDAWELVDSESSEHKFVYVKYTGTLVTQKFEIIINRPKINREADFDITRVVPVQVSEEGNFVRKGEISGHCNDSFPKDANRDPRRITHNSVSLVCSPDSQQYDVVFGEENGSEDIALTTSGGEEISFFAVYSDLTAYPSSGELYDIISSLTVL